MIAEPAKKRALATIFFILLLDVLGFAFLLPVSPFIVRQYSDQALMVTMMTVIYSAGQFFAAPAMGRLGDRFGRRPVLLISIFGQAAGYVIFAIGGSLSILFLSRLFAGITAGNQSVAAAAIVDMSKPEERAKNLGLVGTAWGVGLMVGPALGALFAQISLSAPAWAAAVLGFLAVGLTYFLIPETLPKEMRSETEFHVNEFNPFASVFSMLRHPALGGVMLVLCLFYFAFAAINGTESLYLIDKFNAQPLHIGVLLVVAGIAVVCVNLFLINPLVKRFGEKKVAEVSLVGMAAGAIATYLIPIFWQVYPMLTLRNATTALVFPALTALVSNRVSVREQGTLMGVNTGLQSLMTIFGPLWAGFVYDRISLTSPYWSSAIVLVIGAAVLLRLKAIPADLS